MKKVTVNLLLANYEAAKSPEPWDIIGHDSFSIVNKEKKNKLPIDYITVYL